MEDLPEELKLQYKGRPGPRKPPATCSQCGALISNAQGIASASSGCGDDASVEDAVNILAGLGHSCQGAPVDVPESTESQDPQRSTSRKEVRWNLEGMSENQLLPDVHDGPCYATEFLQVSHTLSLICKVALTMNPTR